MAALILNICSAIQQLYELSNAFVRTGFDLKRSFNYLKAKERQLRYRQLCREVWQTYWQSEKSISSKCTTLKPTSAKEAVKMQRAGIDFAAIEASAMAYEAIDDFAVRRPSAEVAFDGQKTKSNYNYDGDFEDIEVLLASEIEHASFYDYTTTLPVYYDDKVKNLHEGVSFTITGVVEFNCERFSINFTLIDARNVALHINPRLPQNYIVRNTKVKDSWGREEVSSALPFSLHRGSKFSIQVLITEPCYMISVNGHHFANYTHRLPYKAVTTIDVRGDVSNVRVDRAVVTQYPDRLPESEAKPVRLTLNPVLCRNDYDDDRDETDTVNTTENYRAEQMGTHKKLSCHLSELQLPYYGRLPIKSLTDGRCLKIEGRVKLLPHSFYINLQQGLHIWPHPTIAFHFNPRFAKSSGGVGKAIVCRNSWHDGDWDEEECSELMTDFRPGKAFSMVIVCWNGAFEVYVNLKLVSVYKYRVPPDVVDSIYIQGDIKLWDVALENNPMTQARKSNKDKLCSLMEAQ